MLTKLALAVGAALLLGFIGARAGANPSTSRPVPAAPEALAANGDADGGATLVAAQPPHGDDPLPGARIALNSAGEEELRKLPGIGPARARAILDLRARLGRFRSPRDLLRVKGIGRKTLQRILPMVVLDAPHGSTDAGAAHDDPHVQPTGESSPPAIRPAPS